MKNKRYRLLAAATSHRLEKAVATSTQSHRESYLLHTSTQRSADQHQQTSPPAPPPQAQLATSQELMHKPAALHNAAARTPPPAPTTPEQGAPLDPGRLPPVRRPAAGASHPRHGPPTPTPKLPMLFIARSAPPHLLRPCRELPSGARAVRNKPCHCMRHARGHSSVFSRVCTSGCRD